MARSKQERDLDLALAELYPFDTVIAEQSIKINRQTLYVDRVLPQRMIAIEVDGIQHFEFSSFFHGNQETFRASKERDRCKEEWLLDNGYTVIRFKYDETITTALLRERILKARNNDKL